MGEINNRGFYLLQYPEDFALVEIAVDTSQPLFQIADQKNGLHGFLSCFTTIGCILRYRNNAVVPDF